jgi:hypothetical protein
MKDLNKTSELIMKCHTTIMSDENLLILRGDKVSLVGIGNGGVVNIEVISGFGMGLELFLDPDVIGKHFESLN